MKRILAIIFLVPFLSFTQSEDCATMEPICTDNGLVFTANTGVPEASTTAPGNDYDCLGTQPNPTWYYLEVSANGNIDMDLSAPTDIDFIIWGPFANLSVAQANCGDMGNPPANNVVDCSFSATANETPSIPGAVIGEVYVMMITNYANNVQDISLTQSGGAGATDCTIINNPPCALVDFTVAVSGCDFQTNDYSVTGTIDYTDPPVAGDLVVEDCNGNITVVASAPFAANGPIAFALNGLPSDGLACDVEVYFTADPTCSQQYDYTAPVCVGNCPTYDLNATSPLETCGNQIYYMEIQNSGCDGFIEFDVVGNYGSDFASEITWDVVSQLSGNTVATGGPGTDGTGFNVTVGPLDPNVEGQVYTICVYDSWGDGFNGAGGFIEAQEGGTVLTGTIAGNFGASGCNIIQVGISVSSSTLTVNTPSGPVVSSTGNCNDHEVGFVLDNANFCTPIVVNMPWDIVCDNTGTTIASGTHTVTVYPQLPTTTDDLVDISWNNATCEWDVVGNNDCDLLDIGNLFTISPDPFALASQCADGNQQFDITYSGFANGPDCCSTGGPLVPITYDVDNVFNDFTAEDSPFGGVDNTANATIPGAGNGGNAISLDMTVSMSGYCFNPPGAGNNDDYWVTIIVDGVIIYDQLYAAPPNNFSETFDLTDFPNGYNENTVVEVFIYPNAISSGATNTTFTEGGGCGPDGNWDANAFAVDLDVTYDQFEATPANCDFSTIEAFTCCSVDPLGGTPPGAVTVECVGDIPAANIALVTALTGDCNPVVTFLNDGALVGGACGGAVTRTYRITDDCNNTVEVTQVITIDDTTDPVFAAAPAALTVECIGDVPAMTNLAYTDNCDANNNVAGVDGALVGGTCGGTITRTWTYTDVCGNVGTATQVITIDDTTDPVFAAAPGAVTVECIGDVPAMTN
ncbi:MAG: hypothetical protein ACI857_001608, partial [Arenicella sp.]